MGDAQRKPRAFSTLVPSDRVGIGDTHSGATWLPMPPPYTSRQLESLTPVLPSFSPALPASESPDREALALLQRQPLTTSSLFGIQQ